MKQISFTTMVLVLLCVSQSESIPAWTNQRLVFTVIEANHTWNEAREICRNNGRWLLSMEEPNAWTMWKLLMDPTAGLPHRPYDVRYWMDIHARDPNNMTDLYHDNCSRVTFLEWKLETDPIRRDYVITEPCVAFDAHWRPFTAILLKYWLGLPCAEDHYFICTIPMDDLLCVDSCHESVYLFPTSGVECRALCGALGSSCTSRFLSLDDFTICHIVKSSLATSDTSYNICYFPELYGGLQVCTSPESLNLNFTTNDQTVATDLCAESDTTTQYATTEQQTTQQSIDSTTEQQSTTQETTKVIQTTEGQSTTQETTKGIPKTEGHLTTAPIPMTTSTVLCECPCSIVANISDPLLTIEEKVEKLKKELTVNKRNTSSHRRSLISVADHRVSATSIGSMGVVILSVVLGSICLLDLTNVRCGVIAKKCCKRKSKKITDKRTVIESKLTDDTANLKPSNEPNTQTNQ